jgi:acyl-CoA hydrolase
MNPLTHNLAMTVLMTPDMANFSGNVHGGTILKLLDQVAYACASRHSLPPHPTKSGVSRRRRCASSRART